MTVDQLIEIMKIVIWPALLVLIYLTNISRFKSILTSLENRIKDGSEIEFQGLKVGAPITLPNATIGEKVTDEHLALVHSSWRYPKKDKEFGKKMYGFQVIVEGQKETLDRIEYVKYILSKSYPNWEQIKHDRKNHFELKELAWGTSTVNAEIKIKGQEDTIKLSRYINLSETGEKLLED
jgi:hypothetical protein